MSKSTETYVEELKRWANAERTAAAKTLSTNTRCVSLSPAYCEQLAGHLYRLQAERDSVEARLRELQSVAKADISVLWDALWKASGDSRERVREYVLSQGGGEEMIERMRTLT